ncbi:GlxA family transcriptional regulator [Celeribacter indicus]|uniref:AraC family transcriptional regulator n=1 Tax=Celeribacter indicus TaxID=1208324 RepID=A0A0B5DX70_9RHOB|nr:GlxA family transcriptional regulator [Celeribacter indicus]AJE44847.1 AraC family transcriptional regulator [Celeribacter indicus]
MSTAAALEPLRAANLFSREPLYDVRILSVEEPVARASVGARFDTVPIAEAGFAFDLVFVVAGGDPLERRTRSVAHWLRRLDREGVPLGGISGGATILAEAGLLQNRRFTVHWHHYADVERLFPDLLLERRLFVIDRDRYTCAGGSAPLDMMHAIISREHGTSFAQRISDWFIQTEVRRADAPQQASIAARYGTLPAPVLAAIELMESHIADPLDAEQIASLSGLSTRQLQRQFSESLGTSLMETYREIRLETARDLVRQSRLKLSEIALMTGFGTQAHFADSFRRHFGKPPSTLRRHP